jgi:DNA-binding NarL/FixJ family response regulator
VVGEASDGREAVEMCLRLRPEVVLMDVQMPVMGGIEATRRIKQQLPSTIVLILTAFASPEYLLEAIKAGASGYALKHASPQQIIGAIRKVLEGELPFDQGMAMELLVRLVEERQPKETPPRKASEERPKPPLLREPLTPREEEVLRLLVEGQTNQQIAQSLFVSTGTIKHHVHHLMSKLGASDRVQAILTAIELGLLTDYLN